MIIKPPKQRIKWEAKRIIEEAIEKKILLDKHKDLKPEEIIATFEPTLLEYLHSIYSYDNHCSIKIYKIMKDEKEKILEKIKQDEELKTYYSHSTYRINLAKNPEIWKAKSYFMIGDIEKAIAILYPLIKDEIKNNKDKKSIAEKIAPYFTIGNAGTNIIDKLLPYIDKLTNYI